MVKCEICGRKFKHIMALSVHISHTHKIKTQEYYDKYLKKENEGKCLECKNNTTFVDLNGRYRKFCSVKCSNKNKEKQEKFIKTNQKHFGKDNSSQSEVIKEKKKQTNLKRYGSENWASSDKGKEFHRKRIAKQIEFGLKNNKKFSPIHGEIKQHINCSMLPNQQRFGYWPDQLTEEEILRIDWEVDGADHDYLYAQKRDRIRDQVFIKNGYIPLRIKEKDWFEDKELQIIKVQETIKFLKQVYYLIKEKQKGDYK